MYVGEGIGVCFGIFFVRESVPGEGRIGWKGVKKLFIDRLKGRGVVLAASRRSIGEVIWWDC